MFKVYRFSEAAKVMGQLKVEDSIVAHVGVQSVELLVRRIIESLSDLRLVDAPRLLVEPVVEVVLAVGLWLGPPRLWLFGVVEIVVENVWQLRIRLLSLVCRH